MVKLTDLFLGVIFGIVVFVSLFNFMSDGINRYGIADDLPSDFNNSYTIIRGELDNINETTSSIKTQLESITAQSGLLDYLGFFFNAGYKALTGAGQITKSMFVITDEGFESANGLGESGSLLKTSIYMSIVIIFFVGIIMHAIIKSDRI